MEYEQGEVRILNSGLLRDYPWPWCVDWPQCSVIAIEKFVLISAFGSRFRLSLRRLKITFLTWSSSPLTSMTTISDIFLRWIYSSRQKEVKSPLHRGYSKAWRRREKLRLFPHVSSPNSAAWTTATFLRSKIPSHLYTQPSLLRQPTMDPN